MVEIAGLTDRDLFEGSPSIPKAQTVSGMAASSASAFTNFLTI